MEESKPAQIHDKCKQVIIFHNHLVKFVRDLKQTFPDMKASIKKCINKYKSMPRVEFIKFTHESLLPHISKIAENDEAIFSDDYIDGPLELIADINFKHIWTIIDSDDFVSDDVGASIDLFRRDTKDAIFNSLNALYICANIALMQINSFDKALNKQKEFLMNMIGNLNLDEKLKEKIEKLEQAEKEGKGESVFESLEKLGGLLGEDNFIYQMAKEITDEINIGGDGAMPVEALTSLFANNCKKLNELIITLGNKIEEKIQKGEITREQLVQDASMMHSKIKDTIGAIPGLEELGQESIMGQYRAKYDEMGVDEKKQYEHMPAIFSKDMCNWDETDKRLFEEFSSFILPVKTDSVSHNTSRKKKKQHRNKKNVEPSCEFSDEVEKEFAELNNL